MHLLYREQHADINISLYLWELKTAKVTVQEACKSLGSLCFSTKICCCDYVDADTFFLLQRHLKKKNYVKENESKKGFYILLVNRGLGYSHFIY